MTVLYIFPLCSLLEFYRRFRGATCFHHEGDRKILPHYAALQPAKQPPSYSPPWEPKISQNKCSRHSYTATWIGAVLFILNCLLNLSLKEAHDNWSFRNLPREVYFVRWVELKRSWNPVSDTGTRPWSAPSNTDFASLCLSLPSFLPFLPYFFSPLFKRCSRCDHFSLWRWSRKLQTSKNNCRTISTLQVAGLGYQT
jgi:hypothetical protein